MGCFRHKSNGWCPERFTLYYGVTGLHSIVQRNIARLFSILLLNENNCMTIYCCLCLVQSCADLLRDLQINVAHEVLFLHAFAPSMQLSSFTSTTTNYDLKASKTSYATIKIMTSTAAECSILPVFPKEAPRRKLYSILCVSSILIGELARLHNRTFASLYCDLPFRE
jgi:hypothetical protein